jgi:hypothetical protein
MTMRTRSCATAVLLLVLVATTMTRPATADDTIDYVVRTGDTCSIIAVRELGDRKGYRAIHQLNPQLGASPHVLVPGSILRLPSRSASPDAQLSGARGSVRVRDPSQADWSAARRGMDLFRAWRVNTSDRSTAEVRFRDQSRLGLRENTIIIVYGPTEARTREVRGEAVLERGVMRSRIGELSGVKVRLPGGDAELGAGSAVIEVSVGGTSTVSNHAGRAVRLRGAGGTVAVGSGMGTRAETGRAPERPRPLPPSPQWAALPPVIGAIDGLAAIDVSWEPVAEAAAYHVEFLRGDEVVGSATTGPGDQLAARLAGAPAGTYAVRVAARTRDGLEGRPALYAVLVIDLALVAPGAHAPRFPRVAAVVAPAMVQAVVSGPVAVTIGSHIVGYGAACMVTGTVGGIVASQGPAEVRCTAANGAALPAIAIEGVEATATLDPPGAAERWTLTLQSAIPVGEALALSASPGVALSDVVRTPTGFSFALTRVVSTTPGWIAVRSGTHGARVATVALD